VQTSQPLSHLQEIRSRSWAQIENRADVQAHYGHYPIRKTAMDAHAYAHHAPSMRASSGILPHPMTVPRVGHLRGHPHMGSALAPINTSTTLRRAPLGGWGTRVRASFSLPLFRVEERDRAWAESPAPELPGTSALLHNAIHFAFGGLRQQP
jgi:hypothetical protein